MQACVCTLFLRVPSKLFMNKWCSIHEAQMRAHKSEHSILPFLSIFGKAVSFGGILVSF